MPEPGGLDELVPSGAGLLFAGTVAVSAAGRATSGSAGIYVNDHEAAWRHEVEKVRARTGAAIAITLTHAGARAATRPRVRLVDVPLPDGEGWDLIAASAVPYTLRSSVPRAVGRDDMEAVQEEFVVAARRARDAGFDMVEIDMARGYLLASFISPLTNRRTDDYGGPLENRLRFPLEVLGSVRAEWPVRLPVGVAISASDWSRGGLPLSDAVAVARALHENGAAIIRVGAGQTVARYTPRYDPYFLTHLADRVRNNARVPTIATGDIATIDHVNTIVAGGRADFCLLRA